MNELIHILPLIAVLVTAVALLIMSMYDEKFTTKSYLTVSSLSLILILGFIFFFIPSTQIYSLRPYNDIFNDTLIFDTFSNFFHILLILGTLLTLLIGEHYFQKRAYFKGEFFAILMFALFGMMLLANANELVTAFIAL